MLPVSTDKLGLQCQLSMPGPVLCQQEAQKDLFKAMSKQQRFGRQPTPLKGGVADLAAGVESGPAASPDTIHTLLHQHHQLLGRLTASYENSAATAAAPGSNLLPAASPAQHGCSQTRSTASAAAAASAIANGVMAYSTGAGSEGPDNAASAAVSAVLAAVAAAASAADAADKVQRGMGAYGRAAGATLVGLFSRLVGVNSCCCGGDIACSVPGHACKGDDAAAGLSGDTDDEDDVQKTGTPEPTEAGAVSGLAGPSNSATAPAHPPTALAALMIGIEGHACAGQRKRPVEAAAGHPDSGKAAKAAAIGDSAPVRTRPIARSAF